jgi:hypothetical protein
MRIAAESLCDIRTVRRVYSGADVRKTCVLRIVVAAKRLGLAFPPGVQSDGHVKPTT